MVTSTLKKATATYNDLAPVKTVRRARRAYVGLHGLMFERAKMRAIQARELSAEMFSDFVVKGELIEAKASVSVKQAQDKVSARVKETTADVKDTVTDMLPSAKVKIEDLEAEVTELQAKLKTVTKDVKKTAKAKTAKKPAAKKDVTIDTVADKYVSYIEGVREYDADADAAVVKKIVDYCGIALQSRDGMFVACSDETERNTVRDSLLVKKFGLTDEQSELDALVMAMCESMSKDRMKNRVTFYYLLAKNEGKLAAF